MRLWGQPYADLLQFPGLLPLAILGRTEDRVQTLREVSSLIDNINDRREQSNIIAATSLLAGLVLEKNVVRSILREEIMQESTIYQDIIQEGRQQGIQQGKADLVLRLLKRRVSNLNPDEETRIANLSEKQLEALGEALFDLSSREDLLTWLDNN
jgi:predicted transposase YdaD